MSRPLATTITFFISALAHELVMGCITRKFRGYGFFAMMLQMPIVMVQRSRFVKGRTLLNNVLFWCSMILGLSMVRTNFSSVPYYLADRFRCARYTCLFRCEFTFWLQVLRIRGSGWLGCCIGCIDTPLFGFVFAFLYSVCFSSLYRLSLSDWHHICVQNTTSCLEFLCLCLFASRLIGICLD